MSDETTGVVAYYPGCSAKTTEKAYLRTAISVLRKLGFEPVILDRAPCCGTLEAELVDVNIVRGLTDIIMREAGQKRLITGCSGCYSNINRGGGSIDHLVKFLHDEVGVEELRKRVVRSLDLKVATYYGCQALRPRDLAIDDPEDPHMLEDLMEAIGAKPVDFSMRLKCCGGPLTLRKPNVAVEMARSVVESAKEAGADAIVTMCNLCHFMLDFYGGGSLPILHFTQLIARAMGSPFKDLGLEEHFTPVPRNLL